LIGKIPKNAIRGCILKAGFPFLKDQT